MLVESIWVAEPTDNGFHWFSPFNTRIGLPTTAILASPVMGGL